MAMGKGFRVLEKSNPPNPYSVLLEQRNRDETLLFESQAVAVLSAQETESVKKQYTKLVDAYGCLGVLQLNAGETTVLYLVLVTACVSVGKIKDSEVFRITQTHFVSLRNQAQDDERVSEVRRLLNSGTFYFCWSPSGEALDLTLCAQRRTNTNETDNRFFWNRMLHIHLLRFSVNCSQWLLKTMCGSVEIRTVYTGSRKAQAAVVSRLSCERAGTRFNVRGSSDDGHVANFVETEQVIYLDSEVTSFLQTRGSVPLFWEQPGVQVGPHKVKMSRGFEASSAVFDRHLTLMKDRYGRQVIVNLLGTSMHGNKDGEGVLSHLFQSHHELSRHKDVPHVIFDYHQECRGGNAKNLSKLLAKVEQYLQDFSVFYSKDDEVISEQTGCIRTNCLDCLDRTNSVQTFFGLEMLNRQLELLELDSKQTMVSRFQEVFRQMWINNGNEVSKMYAGTGAIQGGSKLMDGARSAARTIQNNLLDYSKQEAIDILLLGSTLSSELADRARILLPSNMLHAPTSVLREMCKRYREYAVASTFRVAVGTYNVNGGKHFRSVVYKDVSLDDWLLDGPLLARSKSLVDVTSATQEDPPVDIYAIGFEEIVDLNASNIMAASSENADAWAEELQKVLSRDREYALITYLQLVGVCLYVFVRKEHTPFIRDVAVDSVKTGLGGATGNKGACAVRFVIHSTSMCFVCAHFAAGQSQVNERNADYAEITRKIAFPMGRTLNSHDYVFWCGDFNYRIDMDKEELKECLKRDELQVPLQYDQLLVELVLWVQVQKAQGNVFKNFNEGEITFPPTYKYDLFSDDYDTSEKMRAPAWTDRVLWKRRKQISDAEVAGDDWNPGTLVLYNRAELKQSDHRPVIAVIDVDVFKINEALRETVFDDVIQYLGPPDATIVVQVEDAPEGAPTFDDAFMNELLQELSKIGDVILVRFVEETLWVTFRDGQCALAAVSNGPMWLCGCSYRLSLKNPDWPGQTRKEVVLCSNNTVPLIDKSIAFPPDGHYRASPIPTHPYRNEDGSGPRGGPPPPRPAPPSRPPPPSSSPLPQPKQHHPKAGVVSVAALRPATGQATVATRADGDLSPPERPPPERPPPARPSPVQPHVSPPSDSNPPSPPQSAPRSPPQSLPQSAPQSPPQSLPQSAPQSPPQSLPQSAPQSPPQSPPQEEREDDGGAIYEEIVDGEYIECRPVPSCPPPPPPLPLRAAPSIPARPTAGAPPPIPDRPQPPPVPARSARAPPIPARSNPNTPPLTPRRTVN